MNFKTRSANGSYSLKIQPEFLDTKTGESRTAGDFNRFRVEIDELTVIQEYCRTNNLDHLVDTKYNNVSIMKKTDAKVGDEVFAVADTCTHSEASLSEGEITGSKIECWLHGAEFDLRTGEALTPPATAALKTFKVLRNGNQVTITE